MTNYKDTLNLPKTDFPMKGNLAQREPQMLEKWQQQDIYQALREHCKGREKFILNDGPPYANGNIHIGHAVNKILKDVILKAKMLSGFDTPYIPGWDCHGLPIELNVEKKVGKAHVKVSPKVFRQACRDYAQKQVTLQSDSFQRLGVFADWDNPYLSMDPKFEANVIRTLGRVIEKGHLHRGYKPVHWCTDCGSALAEAEVEYQDKKSPAIDVRFQVLDVESFWQRCDHTPDKHLQAELSVIIWTTTPWTLPANQACALNPAMEYVIVECKKDTKIEYLFLAEALLKDCMQRYAFDEYRVVAYCRGDALEGLKLQHPFYDRTSLLVLGDHVTLDAGTGIVHTAPAHGQDDYIIGCKYKLPVDHEVKANGCFSDNLEMFAGLHVLKANNNIVDELKLRGNLLHMEIVQHSYPHCWRHKTPLIFRGTPQWFISMQQKQLREKALEQIKKVQWVPDWGQARIEKMVENRPDWCISRQRVWGVPIPLFLHKDSGKVHPDTLILIEAVAKLVEQQGIDVWEEIDMPALLGEQANDYEKNNDTLDVWFDSGAVHACVLEQHPDLSVPADLYLEGSDQHRGWFQTSLLSAVAIRGAAPYRAVLTHGFVVDAQGRKMSKSLGNVIAPDKVFKTLGADTLRLWTAATDYRAEMNVSDEILKRNVDVYRRIRNTARFLLSNLADFDPAKDLLPPEKMLALDCWAVDRTRLLQQEIIQAYDDYQFHLVTQKIHNFCAMELGSFYLDIIKDRQYTTQAQSLIRRSAQTAMYHIAHALTRWLAPILSFTAEEIWQYLPGADQKSIFMTTWYENLSALPETESMNQDFWQQVLLVRDCVNKELEQARIAGVIGSALAAEVTLHCTPELYQLLYQLADELRFVLITSQATLQQVDKVPANAMATEVEGLWLQVAVSGDEKCVRCWHQHDSVGKDQQHEQLCARCVENLTGQGEQRLYA